MATVQGWARRLNAVEEIPVSISTGIYYDKESKPTTMSIDFIDSNDEDRTPRKLRAMLNPEDARKLGDAIVDFLSKREE